jgi:hypothetical protein
VDVLGELEKLKAGNWKRFISKLSKLSAEAEKVTGKKGAHRVGEEEDK